MAYGEVQGKTWRSPNIRGLTDSQKLAWPYFLSNKHSNMLGYYELPIPYMADDLEWSIEKSEKVIKKLEERGLIAYDRAAQIIFVCKYMKYNSLSRGARETGAITRLDDLVDSPLLVRLSAAINEWQPRLEDLIACLEKRCPDLTLFGDQPDSSRSPSGDIVIVTEEDKEGVKSYKSAKGKILKGEVLERFESFLTAFGDRRGKADAADSWFKLKPMPAELYAEIIAGAERYAIKRAAMKNGSTPKMAQGWLTSRRWEDKTGTSNPTIHQRDASEYEKAFDKEER